MFIDAVRSTASFAPPSLGLAPGFAPGGRAAAPPPRFDAGDLYGKGGPTPADIRQNNFGDCYYVATLAAVAGQQPDRIRDAIRFDAATGTFSVTLYDANGRAETIRVTQAEIASNIACGGGSTADNTGRDARIWPDVMEVAYAKQLDTDHADGIEQGYRDLADGGYPQDAMCAITGDRGTEIRHHDGIFESTDSALDRTARQVNAALGNDRPVTLWSVEENRSLLDTVFGRDPQDGLVDNHVYSVEKVAKDGNGEWQVTLRNPWATNDGVEGGMTKGASITVSLRTLVDIGGLEAFTAGPAGR